MHTKNADIKEFDLSDAIHRTAEALDISKESAKQVILQFLEETENGLAEHGAVKYMNHFSIILKRRKPRNGILKGKEWKTPARVEPEFEASAKLKERVSEKQGVPCA